MSDEMYLKPIDVLLVEDNLGDIRLVQENFKTGKIFNNLHVVEDGIEAMNFLYRREKYADVPRPDIILLDLNLPKKDGREVLEDIKKDDDLRQIPVIILTTSKAEEDILQTYNLLEEFISIARSIENFWLTIVKLPK